MIHNCYSSKTKQSNQIRTPVYSDVSSTLCVGTPVTSVEVLADTFELMTPGLCWLITTRVKVKRTGRKTGQRKPN